MATPTPGTRVGAHAAVGVAGAVATKKLLGTGGLLVLVAGFLLGAFLHELLDAPVAQLMANLGLQF